MDGSHCPAPAAEASATAAPTVTVKVAHTMDEMMHAFVIRGAVFVGEQRCPIAEEFDGNDFTATHLVAYVDGEPAGTMRLRYFGGFVKSERAAVLKHFRGLGVNPKLLAYARDFSAQKGFQLFYGTAQVRLLDYWCGLGFRPINKPHFVFSDHAYAPIATALEPPPGSLDAYSDSEVLNRPEGAWDRPGVLEMSVARGASCPTGEG